ncbi:hypothetical protein NJ7G_0934 [Natrinema sp. J7-2]|nr:hypothetical protein NJ7G_0934 [Natrinema sp. J7-2]
MGSKRADQSAGPDRPRQLQTDPCGVEAWRGASGERYRPELQTDPCGVEDSIRRKIGTDLRSTLLVPIN